MHEVRSTPVEPSAAEPAAPRAAFAEDFLDVLYAPSAVFERRRDASPWPAILVITGIMAIAAYIMLTLLGPAVERDTLRAMGDVPAEQRDGAVAFARYGAMLFAVLLVPIGVLALGVLLWLVGKLFDAEQSLRSAFLVVTLAWMPRVIETILTALQAFMVDVNTLPSLASVSLSPARFIDPVTQPGMVQVLARVGPFVIWSYVIIAIGLKVTGRISGAKAALATVIVWVVATVPALIAFLRQ